MEYLKAFIVGGLICVIGQILIDKTKLTPGKILVTFVVAGVFLELAGIYKYVVDFGGMGAKVPLIGFGYNLCKGVREAVAENGVMGILTGGIEASAAGISAAIIFGLLTALIFKSKPKN